MKSGIHWINWAKFVAILAVLVDHSYGVLYSNRDIAWGSYFSVALFIIISGMTSYISNQTRKNEKWYQTFRRASSKIIVTYLVAALIYIVLKTHELNLRDYIIGVLNFNISGPFYFVFLYLQLMFISRHLFDFINKSTLKKNILLGGCILIIASFSTRYTNVFDIYGGGGKVLGGTYLICFYLGMIFMKYNIFAISMKKSIFFAIFGLIGYFLWWNFVCIDQLNIDSKIPFGNGFEPPSISFIIMAIMVLCAVYGVSTILQILNCNKVLNIFSWLGTHTLYIFLYHRILLETLDCNLKIENRILECVAYFSLMIGGSILIEVVIKKIAKVLCLEFEKGGT